MNYLQSTDRQAFRTDRALLSPAELGHVEVGLVTVNWILPTLTPWALVAAGPFPAAEEELSMKAGGLRRYLRILEKTDYRSS